MSLTPALKLGIWNAWILMLLSLIIGLVSWALIGKQSLNKFRTSPNIPKTNSEELSEKMYSILTVASMIYCIFLPLKLGTIWFHIGLSIWILSEATSLISFYSFGSTPLDELVTSGAYRFSRNPVCLAGFLLDVSIGVACASWIYLLYAVVSLLLMHISIGVEERFLLDKYGNSYQEYMRDTPRWIGIPRSKKK